MQLLRLMTVIILAGMLVAYMGCERKVVHETDGTGQEPGAAAYVGSQACDGSDCHAAKYASFIKTGHPFKLNEAEDAQQGSYYPFTSIASPPPGVSWENVDKVIGGFWWKARFIDNNGFIITGDEVQYNIETDDWVAYHSGEVKPYACGPCHMTAYRDTGFQEGKEGLVGVWEFNGIQCEECHGPAGNHIDSPYTVDMVIDRSNEQCGKCHIRGDVNEIPASGGFVKHHEQWNEMAVTKHASIKCVDCHDVHYGLHPLNPERDQGIKFKCENCHYAETETFINSSIDHYDSPIGPDCVDCHMPKAAKSAVGDLSIFTGDIRSHLWRINIDPNANMWNADSSLANGFLTVDYVCLQCHVGESKSWAASNADEVHVPMFGGKAQNQFSGEVLPSH
jgi:hypothetical protein